MEGGREGEGQGRREGGMDQLAWGSMKIFVSSRPVPKDGAKIAPKAMTKGKRLSWHMHGCTVTHCLLIPSFSRGSRQA